MTAMTEIRPTGVRCGNRKVHGSDIVYHPSAAAVKACFTPPARSTTGTPVTDLLAAVERNRRNMTEPDGGTPARQSELVVIRTNADGTRLVEAGPDAYAVLPPAEPAPSGLNAHLDDPRSFVTAKAALIPVSDTDGFAGYATYAADGETVELWEVERPATGKHAGVTFIRPATKTWRDNLKGAERARVILAIAEDPKAAALLYAKKTSKCGICRRTLKKEESVLRGMGPKCASKFG